MSQLSGKTLDLRNSAALLKLARMSVDATASAAGESVASHVLTLWAPVNAATLL